MNITHPIRNEVEYDEALDRVKILMDAPEEDDIAAGELEVLVLLVKAYEDVHHRVDPPSAVDAIKFRMEQANLEQRDLVGAIGSASKVSEVLSGKRPLSLQMIVNLHNDLGIPYSSLMSNLSAVRKPRGTRAKKRAPQKTAERETIYRTGRRAARGTHAAGRSVKAAKTREKR